MHQGALSCSGCTGCTWGDAAGAADAQAALIAPPVVAEMMRMLEACSAIQNANLVTMVLDQYVGAQLP